MGFHLAQKIYFVPERNDDALLQRDIQVICESIHDEKYILMWESIAIQETPPLCKGL